MTDHPFMQVFNSAMAEAEKGRTIYQKFTCSHCGTRQTIDVPNTFYKEGSCEECHQITDIVKHGCDYVMVIGNAPTLGDVLKAQEKSRKEVKERKIKQ